MVSQVVWCYVCYFSFLWFLNGSTRTWESENDGVITLESKIVEVDFIHQYTVTHNRFKKHLITDWESIENMNGGIFLKCKRGGANAKELHIIKDDHRDLSDAFDHSRIANFSDDAIGVLGWKGTGLLLIILILGFSIFKVFFY